MADTLIADIETNGFLESVTELHCIVLRALELDVTYVASSSGYAPEGTKAITFADAFERMAQADRVVLHNGIAYDLPVLKKLFGFTLPEHVVYDTLIAAKLRWPRDRLIAMDFASGKAKGMPPRLFGNHSLEAFGYRMGIMKGEYTDWCKAQGIEDAWAECRPEMVDYCVQDVAVTAALLARVTKTPYSEKAERVEHSVQHLMVRTTLAGFPFDTAGAARLYSQIVQERDELRTTLTNLFPPWYQPDSKPETTVDPDGTKRKVKVPSRVTVKRTRHEGAVVEKRKVVVDGKTKTVSIKTGGVLYPEGATYTKVALIEFNPTSRHHIADRLQSKYGWVPTEYTDDGSPAVDDAILSALPYPEAASLARYMLLQKRAGQLAEGGEAWLKVARSDGCIHGGYNTIGAVTRRATHSSPNIAQVPRVGSYFGAECRSLFHAGHGFELVGADLSGIELRMLAHYMARWDDGAYAKAVVEGSSDDGTDVHSLNCRALGFEPRGMYEVNGKSIKGRDIAKTFIYAFLYGAGAAKLGAILGVDEEKAKGVKAKFLRSLPALKALIKAVKAKAQETRHLTGLDGGKLYVRSAHAALNTLLQSAGAIVAKVWLDEMVKGLDALGLRWGTDWVLRAWIHDEVQVSVRPELVDTVGPEIIKAIERAGVRLNLRVPITGDWKRGRNWADTH